MIVNNINFCYVFICVEAVDSLFLEILKRPAFLIPKCQFSLPQLLKSLRYPITLDRQRPSSFPQSHTQQAKAVNYIMQVNGETRTDWGNQQIKDSNPVSYFLLSAPPPPPPPHSPFSFWFRAPRVFPAGRSQVTQNHPPPSVSPRT